MVMSNQKAFSVLEGGTDRTGATDPHFNSFPDDLSDRVRLRTRKIGWGEDSGIWLCWCRHASKSSLAIARTKETLVSRPMMHIFLHPLQCTGIRLVICKYYRRHRIITRSNARVFLLAFLTNCYFLKIVNRSTPSTPLSLNNTAPDPHCKLSDGSILIAPTAVLERSFVPRVRRHSCNNPNFWEIEISGIHSNTKFWSQQKLLLWNTRLVSCLLNTAFCSHASNKNNGRKF
jgi:hypothetical protein